MIEAKKLSLSDRIHRAYQAFRGKHVGFVSYGVNVQRCDECEEKRRTILYECDREACGDECPNPECHLTLDISHAVNFEPIECPHNGVTYYEEKNRTDPKLE